MNKKEIINMVKEFADMEHFSDCIKEDDDEIGKKREVNKLKSNINNKNDSEKYKIKIGTSQFKDIANLCKKAECTDEIKLFIKYKISKGNGWNNQIGNKKFGELIINYIEKFEQNECENEREKLVYISEFFGYLFWQAKVTKSMKNSNERR